MMQQQLLLALVAVVEVIQLSSTTQTDAVSRFMLVPERGTLDDDDDDATIRQL